MSGAQQGQQFGRAPHIAEAPVDGVQRGVQVAVAPRGAHPSYAHGYYDRDNAFYVAWDEISRDRDAFQAWIQTNVFDRAATGHPA